MTSRGLASSAVRIALQRSRNAALRFVLPHQAGCSAQLARPNVRAITRYSSTKPQADDNLPQTAAGSSPAPVQDHLALAKPLDFDMASKIDGQESQMVSFELEPGQVIRAEAGNLVFMEDGIEMDTNTGGGMGSMFRRVITGQNMFVTDYVNRGDRNSKVGLGTDVPSKIIRLPLAAYGGAVICQRGAFLAGSHTIDIQTEFTKMMAGFFGGEGFVLQRLTGEGDAFVKASGPLIQRELKEGETLRVSSGSVVAFSTSVQYDVQTIPGFKNVVFGGEGLFITKLTGPGTVFLQGLPFDRMVDQIARRIPGGRGAGGFIPIGIGGSGGGEAGEGEGGGDVEAGGGGGEAAAAVGEGGGVAAAAAGEESIAAASGGQDGSGGESASDLFGDAAPASSSSSSASPSSDSMGGGFSNPDSGFIQPPPESGPSEEPTWSESSFGSEGDATDGGGFGEGGDSGGEGGGDWMEGMGGDGGEEGGGVIGTLKKLYTLFGGGGD